MLLFQGTITLSLSERLTHTDMKSIATCLPQSTQNHNYKHLILIAGFPVVQKRPFHLGLFCRIFMRERIGCRWYMERLRQQRKLQLLCNRFQYKNEFMYVGAKCQTALSLRFKLCFKEVNCMDMVQMLYVFCVLLQAVWIT